MILERKGSGGPQNAGILRARTRSEDFRLAAKTADSGSVFAKNTYDAALNSHVVSRDHNGWHLRICRLQTNLTRSFAIEALQRRFVPANQRHHDVPGVRHLRLFADHVVPVHDVILNHGTAFHLEDERIPATREISQRKGFPLLNRLQRTPRRNPSHEGKLLYLALHYLVLDRLRQLHNFDRAALIVAAPNK